MRSNHEAREGGRPERVTVTPADPGRPSSRRRCPKCGGFVAADGCRGCGQRNTAPRPLRLPLPRTREEHLVARCWCERTHVNVPARDIRNGLTASCGAPDCKEP